MLNGGLFVKLTFPGIIGWCHHSAGHDRPNGMQHRVGPAFLAEKLWSEVMVIILSKARRRLHLVIISGHFRGNAVAAACLATVDTRVAVRCAGRGCVELWIEAY